MPRSVKKKVKKDATPGINGRPLAYDPGYHPDKLLELMGQGNLDCEIYTEFKISKTTFIRWRKDYPEFNEAYEQGLPACEKAVMIAPLKRMVFEGHDKGYKALAHLGRNKFGHDQTNNMVTNNTINVNQLTINNRQDYDKLSLEVKDQLLELNIIDVPEQDVLTLEHDQIDVNNPSGNESGDDDRTD